MKRLFVACFGGCAAQNESSHSKGASAVLKVGPWASGSIRASADRP